MAADVKHFVTEDGTSTLFSRKYGDHYHSTRGAETESMHVYIRNGFEFRNKPGENLRILEVGLGTGLNLCLTYRRSLDFDNSTFNYVAIEPFPVEAQIASSLQFRVVEETDVSRVFSQIHSCEWEQSVELRHGLTFRKTRTPFQLVEMESRYDLIYYDAFGPAFQPEMWNEDCARKLSLIMDKGAVLVTYCAQGNFRRLLQQNGLEVQRLPGPPGKREMIRAIQP